GRAPRPALLNDSGKYDVFAADGVIGYQLFRPLTVAVSYEHFFYSRGYKNLLPFAAIEDRMRLMVDFESGPIDWNLTATVVGSRDLLPYNYGDRYNVLNGGVLSSPKLTDAPAFVTLDTRFSWKLGRDFKL